MVNRKRKQKTTDNPVNGNYSIFWRYYLEPYHYAKTPFYYYPYFRGIPYARQFYPQEMFFRTAWQPLSHYKVKRRPVQSRQRLPISRSMIKSKRHYSNSQLSSVNQPLDYSQQRLKFKKTRKIKDGQQYSQSNRSMIKSRKRYQPPNNLWNEPIDPRMLWDSQLQYQIEKETTRSRGKGRRNQNRTRTRKRRQSSTKFGKQRTKRGRRAATIRKKSRKIDSIDSSLDNVNDRTLSTESSILNESIASIESKNQSTASKTASQALSQTSKRKPRLRRSRRRRRKSNRKNQLKQNQEYYHNLREEQLSQPDAPEPDPSYVPGVETLASQGSIDLSNRIITRSMSRAMRERSSSLTKQPKSKNSCR